MQAAAKWATTATAKELYPWIIRDAQKAATQTSSLLRKLTEVEVTDAVKFAFTKSGLKNGTFKCITNLDARIFMRADRRVAFAPFKLSKNSIVGPLLIETGTAAGFEFAIKPGKHVALPVAKTPTEQDLAWRQHLSLWWLASNDGSLEEPVKK